jgi:hypothetical protein
MFTQYVSVTALPSDKSREGKLSFDFFVHHEGRIIGTGTNQLEALYSAQVSSTDESVREAIDAFRVSFFTTINNEAIEGVLDTLEQRFAAAA